VTTSYTAMSFATVAPRYNAINAVPAAAAAQLGRCLAAAAGPGPALDMGCGAGRIAVPTAAAGLAVVGVDLDGNMLHEAQQAAHGLPFSALRANISRLPFAADSFSSVLSINVLHLVPDWPTVLQEAVRVMQPGGRFIQGRDWLDPQSPAAVLRGQLRMIVGTLEPGLRPTAAASPQVMAEALAALGGRTGADLSAASWQTPIAPAQLLREMADRSHNETWMLPAELLSAALARLTDWVAQHYADPEQVLPVERRFQLTVTDGLKQRRLPAAPQTEERH
jgi:SAM-dependent methyltransferase